MMPGFWTCFWQRRNRASTPKELLWRNLIVTGSSSKHAVARLIEIVGEAARNISAEFKTAHPEIPWPGIVGMRNRMVHEYFRVAPDKVWEVVKKEMPALIALIEPLVPPEEP